MPELGNYMKIVGGIFILTIFAVLVYFSLADKPANVSPKTVGVADINFNYAWGADSDYRLTGLDAHSYKRYSISLGDTAIHPSVVSLSDPFGIGRNRSVAGYKRNMSRPSGGAGYRTVGEFKWRNWMVFTPLIEGEKNENPTLRVSNKDSIDWVRPYAVVTDEKGRSDTVFCREPLCDITFFPHSNHLSDPNLTRTHDGKLLLIVRVSYNGADSIMGMTSANGIEWSPPFRIFGGGFDKVISPCVVLTGDKLYRLYFVNGSAGERCLSYIECRRGKPYDLASSWNPVPVICTVQAGQSLQGALDGTDMARYPWHFEIQRYRNQYIMGWVAGIIYTDGAYFSFSGNGVNFTTHPRPVMPSANPAGGTARDLKTLYKFSFTVRDTETGPQMPIWYSAYNRRGFPYLGYTTMHFARARAGN
jgi:hypothetical protein